MKYQHRVLGMLSLLAVITYLGFMNTAASASSALSAVVFGYLVGYFGNYNTPFIPMVALLSVGALL